MIILTTTKYLILELCLEKLFNGLWNTFNIKDQKRFEVGKTYILVSARIHYTILESRVKHGLQSKPIIYRGEYWPTDDDWIHRMTKGELYFKFENPKDSETYFIGSKDIILASEA